MRRFLSILLVLCMVLSVFPALGERSGRGGVTIVEDENAGSLDAELDEFGLYSSEDGVVYDPSEEVKFDTEVITEALDKLDGMRNILLLGVDSRSSTISGRTDTMIMLTVDIESNVIKMTSFLRDTYVEIPGKSNNRLNAAYVFGGYDLLAKTLQKNFGVKPDAYVMINLSGLSSIIDQLGGVYVDVDAKKLNRVNAVIYWYNQEVLGYSESRARDGYLKKGGYQLLNGKQAEAWARYRYSESDMKRAERQRQLITIIFERICEMSVSELAAFAMKNMGLVKTNMSLSDITSLAPAVLTMRNAEIRELQIPIPNGYTSQTISGMSVLVPDRQKNVNALAKFLKEK